MESQVVIELAGGIAEAAFRGERRPHEVLPFATRHCNIGTDSRQAAAREIARPLAKRKR